MLSMTHLDTHRFAHNKYSPPVDKEGKTMAKKPTIKVTKESTTGLNTRFKVSGKAKEVPRTTMVKEVKQGMHPGYHVRDNGRVKFIASNPDGSKGNNLD